jgi:hypothetical protein
MPNVSNILEEGFQIWFKDHVDLFSHIYKELLFFLFYLALVFFEFCICLHLIPK